MSSNKHDTIHTGNYEEFFILYMDNELTETQRLEVEAFLLAHPELQSEMDLLLSTRLPEETVSLDKEFLYSGQAALNHVDEELLLYLDNELPPARQKTIELELQLNAAYQLRHEQFLQTRLDASEVVPHPNKKELYRRSTRVIAFGYRLRIAAAILLLASLGVLYIVSSKPTATEGATIAVQNPGARPQLPVKELTHTQDVDPHPASTAQNTTAGPGVHESERTAPEKNSAALAVHQAAKVKLQRGTVEGPQTVKEPEPIDPAVAVVETTTSSRPERSLPVISRERSSATSTTPIYTASVTSTVPDRITSNEADERMASNESKGSLKGFFRKATRVFAKKTGLDPTSGDEELLIGALAVKLK